jgi:hypothetical protein
MPVPLGLFFEGKSSAQHRAACRLLPDVPAGHKKGRAGMNRTPFVDWADELCEAACRPVS